MGNQISQREILTSVDIDSQKSSFSEVYIQDNSIDILSQGNQSSAYSRRPLTENTSNNTLLDPEISVSHLFQIRAIIFQQGSDIGSHSVLFDTSKEKLPSYGLHNLSTLGEVVFGLIPMKLTEQTTKAHVLQKYKQILFTKLFQLKLPSKWIETNIFGNDPKENHILFKSPMNKEKPVHKHNGHFICRGNFAFAILLSFNLETNLEDCQHQHLIQNIIFSHFPIIEQKISSITRRCYQVIQASSGIFLKQVCEEIDIHDMFQGAVFNLKLKEKFFQKNSNIFKYIKELKYFFHAFLLAPRISNNLWLKSLNNSSEKINSFSLFLQHFQSLHENYFGYFKDRIPKSLNIAQSFQKKAFDYHKSRVTKYVRNFLVTVLTAIFMHHSSWISPFIKHSSITIHKELSPMIQLLNSLYGTASLHPLRKVTRVIVTGSNDIVIHELLELLTFVLRCDPINERNYILNDNKSKSNHNEEIMLSNENLNPKLQINLNENQEKKMKKYEKINPFIISEILPSTINNINEKEDEINFSFSGKYGNYITLPKFVNINYDHLQDNIQHPMKFGSGLFSDVSSLYCGSFVLSGIRNNVNFMDEAISDLKESLEVSFGISAAEEACCVFIDIDRLLCNVIVASKDNQGIPQTSFQEVKPSEFIKDIFKQIDVMEQLNIPNETIYDFFEEKLEELYITSLALKDFIIEKKKLFSEKKRFGILSPDRMDFSISKEEISRFLRIQVSDIPLLQEILKNLHDSDTFDNF